MKRPGNNFKRGDQQFSLYRMFVVYIPGTAYYSSIGPKIYYNSIPRYSDEVQLLKLIKIFSSRQAYIKKAIIYNNQTKEVAQILK